MRKVTAICHFKQIMAKSATLMVYFTAAKLWFNVDGRQLDTVNGWYQTNCPSSFRGLTTEPNRESALLMAGRSRG
jgi:hypothetical protein